MIETKNYVIAIGRRTDLSGRPLGFAIFRKRAGDGSRFGLVVDEVFGFYIPTSGPKKNILEFECCQFIDTEAGIPKDWNKWPERNRKLAAAAVERQFSCLDLDSSALVKMRSYVDRRRDLASQPLQLTLSMAIAKAA